MTAPHVRPGVHDEAAVSSVLGAILVFALLVVTLVTIQVSFVPVWDEDREARLMQDITTQLTQVKSDLDRQTDNSTHVAIANPLSLQRTGGFRLFSPVRTPANVEFVDPPGGAGVTLTTGSLTIYELNGKDFLGIADDTDWEAVDDTDDIKQDVLNVRALRMRIDMHYNVCDDYDDDDTATLLVEDANGDEAGAAVARWDTESGEKVIYLDIFADLDENGIVDTSSGGGERISSTAEFFFQALCTGNQATTFEYHYFDLLAPDLLFETVLEAADKPLTLTIDRGIASGGPGLGADYVIVYDEESAGGGSTTIGSGGLTVAPYASDDYVGGALVLDTNNQRYPDQSFVLEHGALLRVQGDDAAMAVEPNFRVSASATQISLDWTLPSLEGTGGGIAGADTASVVSTPEAGRTSLLAGTAVGLSITIPTEYPEAWWAFLDRELRSAGLEATSDYTMPAPGPGATSVALAMNGDVFLSFRQATIDLELHSSG